MNEIKVFEKEEFGSIRIIQEEDKTLFCGSDIAKALGYVKPQNAISDHCKGALKRGIPTNGGTQDMLFIPEGDVYRLIVKSRLPEAEKFERWVFEEVLPSIRKNGAYIQGQEEMTDEDLIAKALVAANKILAEREARIAQLQESNEAMKPKADYFDELVDRSTLTSIRNTAKELGVKERKFVSWLIEQNYLYRDGSGHLIPYASEKADGLFSVKECYSSKNKWSGIQTLVTPKGRGTFQLLLNREVVA